MNQQLIALYTLARREVARFLRIWTQTILPSPVTMILYFAIFGKLIGDKVGDMDGVSYIMYIAPGLIMMAIINNSYANVVGSFFTAKFQKSIEEMYVSSMSPWVILAGYVLGGVLRSMLVAFFVIIVALLFTHLTVFSWAITVSIAFMTSLLFSLVGMLNAIFAKKFDDINIIPTFILTPLIYLGGVFYSLDMLPPFWHKVSLFNPILYMVNAFRYGMLGLSDVNIVYSFSFLLAFILCLIALVYSLLSKGVGVRT